MSVGNTGDISTLVARAREMKGKRGFLEFLFSNPVNARMLNRKCYFKGGQYCTWEKMKAKFRSCASLISALLMFALVMAASAQTRTVGVYIGDKFRYSITATWSSDDPNATAPDWIGDYKNTEWLEVSVTAISGTNITGKFAQRFRNETENTVDGWVDVDAGNGTLRNFFISANLAAGDTLYNSPSYSTWLINGTVPRTYLGSVRDTNYINITKPEGINLWNYSLYWDKLTGVLVDQFVGNTMQTGSYVYLWSIEFRIISSAPTPTPPISGAAYPIEWIVAIVAAIVIVIVVVVLILRRRK